MKRRKGIGIWLLLAATCCAGGEARAQMSLLGPADSRRTPNTAVRACDGTAPSSLREALRLVCSRKHSPIEAPAPKTIVIGFVGGFVKHDDTHHPEVRFAAYLRESYSSAIHAEVFSNHEGREALRRVVSLLDADGDGVLTPAEKAQARIIIYGHSWGASETVAFARELGRLGIPVLLTVQVDTIGKPGKNGSVIPVNVANAVNFYQPNGLLHGHSRIVAEDPERTKIIGNLQMSYKGHPINCDNYPWFPRTFNRPHHEIENDPHVWEQIASLIDSELSATDPTLQVALPSACTEKHCAAE